MSQNFVNVMPQLTSDDLNNVGLAKQLLVLVASGDQRDVMQIERAIHYIDSVLREYGRS